MARKYIERYQSFCASLEGLKRARERDANDEFVLSGTIQKFSPLQFAFSMLECSTKR